MLSQKSSGCQEIQLALNVHPEREIVMQYVQ